MPPKRGAYKVRRRVDEGAQGSGASKPSSWSGAPAPDDKGRVATHVHIENDETGEAMVYVFAQPPPDDLLCPLCRDILRDATVTAHGNTFCFECILTEIRKSGTDPAARKPLTEAQLSSNLLARSMVDELEVLCPYGVKLGDDGWEEDPDGCPEVLRFGMRRPHLRTCGSAPTVCPLGGEDCGPVLRDDMEWHLEEECGHVGPAKKMVRRIRKGRERQDKQLVEDILIWTTIAVVVLLGLLMTDHFGHVIRQAAEPLLLVAAVPIFAAGVVLVAHFWYGV
ncbi:unnamed protein product [Pedinophyceae sp. YPF-701]|nr:unnamed protein product [Pedinophyceae sp. YPF-701]